MAIFDPLFSLLQSPIGTIFLVGLVGFGVYYLVTRYLWKPKEDIYEIQTFQEAVIENLDEKFNVKGVSTKSALVQGFDFLGDVDKWLREKGQKPQLIWDEKRRTFIRQNPKQKPKMIEFDLYVFRIWNTNLIFKLLGFGKKKYVIVDSQHMANIDTSKPGFRQWNIKPNVMLYIWGGAFVTSKAGEDYVSDISVLRSHENTMTYLQEFTKKATYLEVAQARRMEGYERKKRVDSKAWERYKRADEYDSDEIEDE